MTSPERPAPKAASTGGPDARGGADLRHDVGALAATMGVQILEATPDRVIARMPVEGNTQPYGVLHGGGTCVLAETVGSAGAALWAGEGHIALGVDINATHHRAVTGGWITAVATPSYRGRTTATFEVVVTGDDGKRVCTARLTCAIRPRPAGSP